MEGCIYSEAVFGGARIDGAGRIDAARVGRFVEAAQARGALRNADALDRAILLVDDLPGAGATGNLVAGERDNETALALNLSGDATFDNAGSRSTGAARASANLALASPLRLGDQATANLLHSDGSD
jgi:hemolysin activation/secretion protein